jgi:hypothetical protein
VTAGPPWSADGGTASRPHPSPRAPHGRAGDPIADRPRAKRAHRRSCRGGRRRRAGAALELVDLARETGTLEEVVALGRILEAAGERVQAGDQIITGSVVQVPLAPGDEVVAEIDGIGSVGLTVAGGAG